MKVTGIKETTGRRLLGGSLPDIDTDFESTKRGVVKEYIKERFGEHQVCDVGTFTTLQLKASLKDLDRVLGGTASLANIITGMIDKDDSTMLDLYKRSAKEPKLKEFIKTNSDIFHYMPALLGQQKSLSIHPCAVIISPDTMTSQEWFPIRLQKGSMVAEWSGGDMDDAGFLKQDILGLKELSSFSNIKAMAEDNDKEFPDIYNLPQENEVYRYFSNGWNSNIFQVGTDSLSAYTKLLKPNNIEDLIATIALYRPGSMENNYHNLYVDIKNKGKKPKYLWGTEKITAKTNGILIMQEQVMQAFVEIGGLTLLESDDVRRAMGKKDVAYMSSYKERVNEGYLSKGATQEEFEESWSAFLEFAKYSFNRSHSVCYADTGYIGQYLKVNLPLEFWTDALTNADEKKGEYSKYLSEIFEAKGIKVRPPDINGSKIAMTSDFDTNTIFWGIGSIKGIGEATAEQIIEERDKNGKYTNLFNFIARHSFTGSKVKKQVYEALISSGAFDLLHDMEDLEIERGRLIKDFRELKKVKVSNLKTDIYTIGQLNENWWWKLQQKKLTGIAFIDYKELAKRYDFDTQYCSNKDLTQIQHKGVFRSFAGYIMEVKIRSSSRGRFAFLTIESNYKIYKLIVWSDQYAEFKEFILGSEGSLIIFEADLKFDPKFEKKNVFTLQDHSRMMVLK